MKKSKESSPEEALQGQQRHLQAIQDATVAHDRLLEDGKLSVVPRDGVLTIFVAPDRVGSKKSEEAVRLEHSLFLQEAEELRERRITAGLYAHAVIHDRPDVRQLEQAFSDPEVAGIALIGHGYIARLRTKHPGMRSELGWNDVARVTGYLKQGQIEQRFCGHFPRDQYLSVPLGTFAVSRYSSVIASPGIVLPDTTLNDDYFYPIYNDSEPVLSQIYDLNDMHGGKTYILGSDGTVVPDASNSAA